MASHIQAPAATTKTYAGIYIVMSDAHSTTAGRYEGFKLTEQLDFLKYFPSPLAFVLTSAKEWPRRNNGH